MKSTLQSPWMLAASLAVVFGSGWFIGRLSAPAQPEKPSNTPALAAIGDDPDVWAARAADRLAKDLQLDPSARDAVRDELTPVANEIFSDRERAWFQMHLRLLAAHDQLATRIPLDAAKQQRLTESRNRLKSLIIRKFPRMVNGHPTLAVEPNSPR